MQMTEWLRPFWAEKKSLRAGILFQALQITLKRLTQFTNALDFLATEPEAEE